LQAIESQSVNVKTLISEQVPFSDFQLVYGDMKNPTRIASLLAYPSQLRTLSRKVVFPQPVISSAGSLRAGIIGAGNFTKATLLPALKKNQVAIQGIASANGLSGTLMAKKYNAEFSTSDYQELLKDEKVSLVIITTRHSLHAGMVTKAIQAGKNVFVEKPLAVNEEELHVLQELFTTKPQASLLHVGFNRRFSPHILQLKKLVGLQPGAMHLTITMNAGALPPNHWTLDPKEGGRIIGEACHLVDLAVYLTGSEVASVTGQSMGISSNSNSDNASFLLEMQSGSNVVINYFANGSKAYSKERIELYYQERTLVMDNFRITTGYGWPGFTKLKTSIDKGHCEQIKQLKIAFESGEPLIPISQLFHVTAVTLAMVQSLKQNARISI
jgi:predicted dehydrogenase